MKKDMVSPRVANDGGRRDDSNFCIVIPLKGNKKRGDG